MNFKTIFASVQWVNLGLLILNVLNEWGSIMPGVDMPAWVIKVQVLLGILLPSVSVMGHGAHRMAYGEAQNPAARTPGEVMKSAGEATAAIVAAAPAGETVTVPSVTLATSTGTK